MEQKPKSLLYYLLGGVVAAVVVALVTVGVLTLTSSRKSALKPAATSVKELEGTITISGAWALYPMVVKWAEEFQRIHPKVGIDVSAGGAGKGAADAIAGLVDIGLVSREVRQEEVEKGAFGVPVTKDAVVATVSEANPALNDLLSRGVKKATFAGISLTEQVTTWDQVVDKNVGSKKIHVYTRSDACGAAETWAKYLGKKQEDLKGVGVYGDPGLAEAVRKDPLGIGYNNIGYAYDAKTLAPVTGIRIIPIDVNENGQIDPEEDFYATRDEIAKAIAEGAYPSPPARDLYFVTKGQFAGLAKEFTIWVLTDGQTFVPDAGYISLPKDKLDDALREVGTG